MRKAQFMMEFIIFIGIAVIFAVVYLGIANELLYQRSEDQRITALNDIGYNLQDEMILATSMTDGYRRSILLPALAGRFTYAVGSDNNSVTLFSGNVMISYDLPAYNGAFHSGTNVITKNGNVTVQ